MGFSNYDIPEKRLFEYEDVKGEAHELKVKNINSYLVGTKDVFVINRSNPICNVPKMMYGNKPTDGGYYLIDDKEKQQILSFDKNAERFIRPFLSAKEFLNNQRRWCFWLVNASPEDIHKSPETLRRIEAVKKFRLNSVAESTRNYPFHTLFRQLTQPKSDFILVPRHSSENRQYIPFGFFDKNYIVADSCNSIPDATLYHFGILTSLIHMAWVKYTCGRIKSDFRYSKDIVYNNFPWPENPNEKQVQNVESASQGVLDARAQFPDASLADLYDPNTMPPVLVKAHQILDRAVDLCYRPQPFVNEAKRIEFLFELYDRYTSGLFGEKKKKAKKQ